MNAMLKQVFGLTAVDWSNMSVHWSQKLSTDYQLAGKYGELNAKYTAQYSAGDADPDDEPTTWTENEIGRAIFYYQGRLNQAFMTVHS